MTALNTHTLKTSVLHNLRIKTIFRVPALVTNKKCKWNMFFAHGGSLSFVTWIWAAPGSAVMKHQKTCSYFQE